MAESRDHVMTFEVFACRDWQAAERQAVRIIRRYARLPARGAEAVSAEDVLADAVFAVRLRDDDLFDATVTRTV